MKRLIMTFKKDRLMMALGAAAALSALMTMPVHADDVNCSSFLGGVIPAGDYNFNIFVDINCSVGPGATVNGNIIEPDDTPFFIIVDPEGNVNGNIEEKGDGFVWVIVGHDQVHNGDIKEDGVGFVLLDVDGIFNGNVEEQGDGSLVINIFGPFPEGGPGFYNGNASQKDDGFAALFINPGALGYNGNFKQEGDFPCVVVIDDPEEQHDGNIEGCD